MLTKIKAFYKRNRVYSILMIISIICIIAILIGVIGYFFGQTTKDKYGNRLDSIKEIKFEESKQKSIEDALVANELVETANVEVKGKLIYVIVDLKTGTHKDSETIAQTTLGLFEEPIKTNYDIQYIFNNKDESITENFPIMGYIKGGNTTIKWTKYSS